MPKNIRKTPLNILGIILQILKNWFRINSEQFKYEDNRLTTKLVIDPSHEFKPEDCQNRPGLYVKIGQLSPKGRIKAGFDDLRTIGPVNNQYSFLGQGSVQIFCVGKLPGEVCKIAENLLDILLVMSPIIRKEFVFDVFDVAAVGEIGILQESKEFWVIPISIGISYNETWEIEEVDLKIDKILLDVKTNTELGVQNGY